MSTRPGKYKVCLIHTWLIAIQRSFYEIYIQRQCCSFTYAALFTEFMDLSKRVINLCISYMNARHNPSISASRNPISLISNSLIPFITDLCCERYLDPCNCFKIHNFKTFLQTGLLSCIFLCCAQWNQPCGSTRKTLAPASEVVEPDL